MRENIGKLVVCDEYLYGVDDKEIENIIKQLRNKKYSHLVVKLRFPYKYYLSL